ncbi:hypothetical protein [Vibrio phage vB_VhaM_VH-8]|nr:hypothetical protein [Vibrio phage vB_VhaM_VH-8]
MNTIESQKEIAKEVLTKLQACDPHCILAGGAPRNWFFNKEANDLDFYIYLKPETTEANELRLKSIGLDVKRMEFEELKDSSYKFMQHLFRVYEGSYRGENVQVMVMREPTFTSVVDDFGVSICEFWWNGGEVQATKQALTSILTKKLFYKNDYSAKETHVEKMVYYFPDYTLTPYSEFEDAYEKLHTDIEKSYGKDIWIHSIAFGKLLMNEATDAVLLK